MSVPVRLGMFAASLVVAFVAAFGLGRAYGPVDDDAPVATTTVPVTGGAPAGHEGGEHGG